MKARKYLLLALLVVLAFGWVSVMALIGSVSGDLRESAALKRRGPFTDDNSIKAEITSVSRDRFKITLTVKLTDASGALISARSEGDFELFEDGEPANLTRFVSAGQAPVRLCLAMDYSNSMRGQRIDNARKSALKLLGMLRDDTDHLGLYLFNGVLARANKQEVLALGPLTAERREQARQAIVNTPLNLGTPMFNTMKAAFKSMEGQTGRRIMIVLGDGADTDFRKGNMDGVLKELAETSAKQEMPIYVVSLEGKTNNPVLSRVAAGLKGKFIDTQKPEDLEGIYSGIGQSLQNEYVVEYESPNPVEDGTTRNVLLTVRQGERGTKVNITYRVPGVTATGAGTVRTPGGASASAEGAQPFWSIFIPLGVLLTGLFVVPYRRWLRPGSQ